MTLTPPLRPSAPLPPTPPAPARPRPSEVLSAGLDRNRRVRELVEQLIAEPARLGPDFAPIRRLQETAPSTAPLIGWKATGRGTPGTEVADTLTLLEQASSLGLVERLDWAFRCHTFDVAMDAGLVGELHLTPEPDTFLGACPPRLAVSWLRGRRSLDVCAELHEDAFGDRDRLLGAVEEMARWGWHLVLSDLTGTPAEASALGLLTRLRPAYVQLDVSRPTADAIGQRRWIEAAQGVGATLMAVGLGSQEQLDRALGLGAAVGRGPLVGSAVSVPR